METGKTTKYFKYAIGEIILVVIGILIALQINNWNDYRKDREKEKSILKELHKEFVANKMLYDTIVKHHRGTAEALKRIVSSMPIKKEDVTEDFFRNTLGRSLDNRTFNPSSGVIESLVNSSNYELIQNDTLRNRIVTWKDALIDFKEDEINTQQNRYRQIDPYGTKHIDIFNRLSEETIKALQTIEFQNLMFGRRGFVSDIIDNIEAKIVENHINDIIRLTAVE